MNCQFTNGKANTSNADFSSVLQPPTSVQADTKNYQKSEKRLSQNVKTIHKNNRKKQQKKSESADR